MTSTLALVTGATGGIGRAVARQLAAEKLVTTVVITGRNRARLAEVEAEITAAGAAAVSVACDLRDTGTTDALVNVATSTEGHRPTILINNAGTAPTAKFAATDDSLLEEVLDLHVRVPFGLIRGLLPTMQQDGGGTFVQIGSSAGLRGFAFTSAYTAAKHAMVGMTRALSAETGGKKGIHTYAVCPGFVDTEITRGAAASISARGGQSEAEAMQAMASLNRIGRMHTVDEVANTVLELCRDQPQGCVYDLDNDSPGFIP